MLHSIIRFLGGAVAFVLLTTVVAGGAAAGPVPFMSNPAMKIEEVERAAVCLTRGQTDEAYKLLTDAVRKYPYLPPARLLLARLFLLSPDGQKQGRVILEKAAAEHPDHPQVYLTEGNVALVEGRISDALLNCQKALDLCNASDRWNADQKKEIRRDASEMLAAAYEQRRDWANTRGHLAALLKDDPKNGSFRQRLACALFFLDKPNDAHQELMTAVKDNTTLEPAAVTMAKFWAVKGDNKEAHQWLDRAVKDEPKSSRVRLAFADWLLSQNDVDAAKTQIDEAVKLRPNDVDALKLKGLVARITKDLTTAEKVFSGINANAPSDFFASNQLALVLADLPTAEQRKRALEFANINAQRLSRTNDPNAVESLATLGYVQYRNNNLEMAWQSLQAATASGQASSDTAYFWALVLTDRDKSKSDDARSTLKTALDAKGLFVYRKDAQALYDKLAKKEPVTDAKNAKGGKD